ncbi:hypothetical protein LTR37_010084 [Vermiconidia calcicola]|uniref:Uncharacterized protein n=1 Tax=Vermiconidia calcicola TaxID=1690605 RepID=A0ACC3N637_9PEZI|nr:hypothetical protein LTR37_010084 [Vermiconidia calcicola]
MKPSRLFAQQRTLMTRAEQQDIESTHLTSTVTMQRALSIFSSVTEDIAEFDAHEDREPNHRRLSPEHQKTTNGRQQDSAILEVAAPTELPYLYRGRKVDVERVRAEIARYSQPGEDLDWTMVEDIGERRRIQSTISRRRCRKEKNSTPVRVQKRPNSRASRNSGLSKSSGAVQQPRRIDHTAAKVLTGTRKSERFVRSASVDFQEAFRASSSVQRRRRHQSFSTDDNPCLDKRQLKEAARLMALGSDLEAFRQVRAETQRKELTNEKLRVEQLEKQVRKLEEDARNTGKACGAGDNGGDKERGNIEDTIRQLGFRIGLRSVNVERREATPPREDGFEKLIQVTSNLEFKFEGKMDVDEL